MSDIDDEEIEKIILAELDNLKDDEDDDDDDDDENLENPLEDDEATFYEKEEDPVIFDELSNAFTNYYTDFMTNIEKEINEFKTDIPQINSISVESNQGLQELLSKDDEEDSTKEEDEERMTAILSSRPTSKLGVDQGVTPRKQINQGNNDEFHNQPEDSEVSENTHEEASEVKIIHAWIETDKEIEKINEQRWNEYKSFLKSIDQSRDASREILQQKTSEEIEATKVRQLELENNLEQLISDQNVKLTEDSQKVLMELESELIAEKEKFSQYNKEIDERNKEVKHKAAVMIQKHFRGYRIRLRIGDDIQALREKAKRKYQKDLIIKIAKKQNKRKAKDYHKIRQQRDIESGRSSIISHSCVRDVSSASSSRKSKVHKNNPKNSPKNSKKDPPKEVTNGHSENGNEIQNISDQVFSEKINEESEIACQSENFINETVLIKDGGEDEVLPENEKCQNQLCDENLDASQILIDTPSNDSINESIMDETNYNNSINKEVCHENNADSIVTAENEDNNKINNNNSNDEEISSKQEDDTSKSPPIEVNVVQSFHSDTVVSEDDKEEENSSKIPLNGQTPGLTKKTAYVLPMQQQQSVKFESNLEIDADNEKVEEDEGCHIGREKCLPVTSDSEVVQENIHKVKQSLEEEEEEEMKEVVILEEDKSERTDLQMNDTEEDAASADIREDSENVKNIADSHAVNSIQTCELPISGDDKSNFDNSILSNSTIPPDSEYSTIRLSENESAKSVSSTPMDDDESGKIFTPLPNETEPKLTYLAPPDSLHELWTDWIKKSRRYKLPQNMDNNVAQRQKRYPRSAKKLAKIPPEVLSKFILHTESINTITVLRLHKVNSYRLADLDSHCPALQVLMANCCSLLTLEGLESCSKLQYIDVRNNQIEYVDLGCASKTELFYINLSKNQLVTVHGLDVCVALRELNISSNKITRLTPEAFQSFGETLRLLDVSYNQLVSTTGLQLCSNLQYLDLSHNNLSEVGEIPSMPYLRQLNLSHNSFSKMIPLWNNCLLQKLHLDQNSIKDLSPFKSYWLPNLCFLGLSNNNLYDLEALPLPLLLQLNVSNNQFIDLNQLLNRLKQFSHLEALNLLTTPCFASQTAEKTVINVLPQLTILNENAIPERLSRKIILDDSAFMRACINFLSSCRYHEERLTEHKKLLTSSETTDVLQFLRYYKRFYDHLNELVSQHKEFQEKGLLLPPKTQSQNERMDQINSPQEPIEFKENITLSTEAAATKIAALYRGYQVRKRMNDQIDELFNQSAVKIQAIWRGYRVRKWIRNALEKMKIDADADPEFDEDFMPSVDISEFNEADVDRMFDDIKLPSSAKNSEERISKVSISQQKRHSLTSPALPTIKNHKSAWTSAQYIQNVPSEQIRPLSVSSRRTDLVIDLDSFRSNSMASQHSYQQLAPISSSRKSKKAEAIMQEWGFQGEACAKSMLQRAKKMKYNSERKQKLSQMDPQSRLTLLRKFERDNPPPSVRIPNKTDPIIPNSGKMDYFKNKALEKMQLEARQYKETQNRIFEWVFDQSAAKPKPMSLSLAGDSSAGRITLPKIAQNDSGRLVTQHNSQNVGESLHPIKKSHKKIPNNLFIFSQKP